MSTAPAASLWKTLLPPAMVGTDKKPLQLPPLPGAVGALLAQLPQHTENPAQMLLQAAGILTVCERAGQHPQPSPLPASHVAAMADKAQFALHDRALHDTLRWLLTEEAPLHLQIHGLQQMATAGWRLPAALLPLALDTAQRAKVLRPAVSAVLGERGRWLAHQNSTWRYAAGTADTATTDTRWQEGTLAQRLQLLQEERQNHPSAARERLQASLSDLPAKERAELLAVFQTGLSADDEALLSTLANQDRSREVRQIARTLLIQLPDSAITQAAIARLQACILLKTGLRGVLGVQPPDAADPDWKNHGIEVERPKHESLGERAWWLYQLARQVPLVWWQQYTGMAPEALLQWVAKNDWRDALVRAWWDVLRPTPDPAWCHALLQHWPGKALPDSQGAVLALLPTEQREPYWLRQLEGVDKKSATHLEDILRDITGAYAPGQYLSLKLSQQLLEKLPLYLQSFYCPPQHLARLCSMLHPDLLTQLQALAQNPDATEDKNTQALARALRQQLPVLMARQALAQLPRATPSPATQGNP